MNVHEKQREQMSLTDLEVLMQIIQSKLSILEILHISIISRMHLPRVSHLSPLILQHKILVVTGKNPKFEQTQSQICKKMGHITTRCVMN